MNAPIDEIRTSRDGSLFEITIARPSAKNALTVAMYAALSDALRQAEQDDSVHVILLRGEGGNFTSGNDLRDFLEQSPTSEGADVFQFMHTIARAKKPIIAVVEGFAVGIGTTMLLHCDLVYAADNAKFSMPFTSLGVVPEAASSFVVPRVVGHRRAAEILFFGEPFDASTARDLGLVSQILPAGEVLAFAKKRAAMLANQPREAILRTKELLKSHDRDALLAHMSLESRTFLELLVAPAAQEIIRAFVEKRKPDLDKVRGKAL